MPGKASEAQILPPVSKLTTPARVDADAPMFIHFITPEQAEDLLRVFSFSEEQIDNIMTNIATYNKVEVSLGAVQFIFSDYYAGDVDLIDPRAIYLDGTRRELERLLPLLKGDPEAGAVYWRRTSLPSYPDRRRRLTSGVVEPKRRRNRA